VTDRVYALRERLEEPLLVTNLVNVRYLTGFESSNAALLVEPGRVQLFTDFRYAEAAREHPDVVFVQTARAILGDLAERLSGRIGFEAEHVAYAGWETLNGGGGGLELVPRRGLVEELRAIKAEEELQLMRRAAAISDRAFVRLARERFTGRTEKQLAWLMQELIHEEGADDVAFPVIVAAGPTGAQPHAHPGDRVVGPGETVVVDAGARVGGYCSDCTRTFVTGDVPDRLRRAYDVCLDAQVTALDAMRMEARGSDVDAVARQIIDATEFGGLFGHGLGHGVGLDVHERPAARPESTDTLAPHNVISCEPGIYVPGEGGIRIEDLVVVSNDGGPPEVLTTFTKDLVSVA
jgi:Xaa-Pro aminopeptidase